MKWSNTKLPTKACIYYAVWTLGDGCVLLNIKVLNIN